jgi:hypothetical protein
MFFGFVPGFVRQRNGAPEGAAADAGRKNCFGLPELLSNRRGSGFANERD